MVIQVVNVFFGIIFYCVIFGDDSYQWLSDVLVVFGGVDSGFLLYEILFLVLGVCMVIIVVMYVQCKEWLLEGIDV